MRTLLLMRGAPGSGKSTFIQNNKLKEYTICPDDIRLLYSSPELMPDGRVGISQTEDKAVWKTVMEILERRMQKGEFTVIDATSSKTSDISKYKSLCEKYRYRIYIVDFTDIPLEKCLEQNKKREELKWVPEEDIEKIYSRFATQGVPSGVKILKRDELNEVLDKPIDLSKYEKIIHIGDIHGCYNTLMEYLKDGIKSEYCYIFTGDYLDRGAQNLETFQFINSIKDFPNVCLLEGNHEKHIYSLGLGEKANSKEFEENTKNELLFGGIDARTCRQFYRKVRQLSHYIYNDKEVLVCHGGIPSMDKNLVYTSSQSFIKGVGRYEDYELIAETWMGKTKENQYLIHGHRNTSGDEIQIADRVFNLEGGVEFGGCLRVVELDKDGFHCIEVENKQTNLQKREVISNYKMLTIDEAINLLRNNVFIKEKKLGNGISSFNFTRQAFYSANWNNQTILARGLFIDTENKKIMARSYEKFFRINETLQTQMSTLNRTLKFPVRAYVKENGFLAIVSYNYKTDELFIASKSSNTSVYVDYIKNILSDPDGKIKEYLKLNNVSMVFECIDPLNDPHIIEEKESKLVLLDIIENKIVFEKKSYETMVQVAKMLNLQYKKLAYTFNNWEEFEEFYQDASSEDFSYKGRQIEGFVIEDDNGFMTKLKCYFYNFWKKMRGVADTTFKYGYYGRTGSLTTKIENMFYGFCKRLYGENYQGNKDIITLREKFLKSNVWRKNKE